MCDEHSLDDMAEYALRGLDKPIGVSTFELTRALPASLQSALPSIDAIEAELSERIGSAEQADDSGTASE